MNKKVNQEYYYSTEIVLIGDRIAGKTTYLASLVRNPNSRQCRFIKRIRPMNDYTEQLKTNAINILEEGYTLDITSDFLSYFLCIDIEEKSIFKSSIIKLSCSLTECMGEFFEYSLFDMDKKTRMYQMGINAISSRLYNVNIMLLIDGINSKDQLYFKSLNHLLLEIENLEEQPKKIAVVLTKCDYPELYPYRHKAQKIIAKLFPKTYRLLERWKEDGLLDVEYFCASAFGMIKNQSSIEPNCVENKYDEYTYLITLKNAQQWKPFGLVHPIYWLATGNRFSALDDE